MTTHPQKLIPDFATLSIINTLIRELARLGLADPGILNPVVLRDEIFKKMLRLHHARNLLVSQRTQKKIDQIHGIGLIGSTVLIATIGGCPGRFGHARDVGAYLGLVSGQDQSGEVDRQLNITLAGSAICRRTLAECAGVVLMSNASETDTKLKGLRIAIRGGKTPSHKSWCKSNRGLRWW